ncbi:hypothetical protein PPERSA_01665 [Pseudocohnilembus persalinus]|uniref:Uncharacterized protein n=1 Tax=Pseudocohnilembus persalinus TaxID=266149 RepID=A0A0V0R1S1_PSEPJ|nr:hypothetical protein PPERSA_01665 [Pseudocohnilembus persalinus]|eukprot:KRX08120.1 hypothetical protein PPERSA_01665 [Pseudocohnilembus persalinus]
MSEAQQNNSSETSILNKNITQNIKDNENKEQNVFQNYGDPNYLAQNNELLNRDPQNLQNFNQNNQQQQNLQQQEKQERQEESTQHKIEKIKQMNQELNQVDFQIDHLLKSMSNITQSQTQNLSPISFIDKQRAQNVSEYKNSQQFIQDIPSNKSSFNYYGQLQRTRKIE